MNPLTFIAFVGCFVLLLSCFRRGTDIFSPGRIFAFFWLLALGLTELKFSALQHSWSPETWVQVLIGPVSFLVGIYCMYVLHLESKPMSVPEMRRSLGLERIFTGRLLAVIVFLFFSYIVAYAVIHYGKGVDPPLFSDDPGKARREFGMFGLGLFLHNVILIVFLSVLYYSRTTGRVLAKSSLVLFSVIAVVLYFFLLQRFQLAFAVVMSVGLLFYSTQSLKLRRFLPFVIIVTGLFYWVSTLRAGQLFMYYLYRDSMMRFPVTYAMFTEPYMYVVMNLENLARSIAQHSDFTFGVFTFDWLFAITGLQDWIAEYFHLDELPYIISGYNTYTSYWTFYRDFGPLGTMVFPLLLGLGVGSIYHKLRAGPTIGLVTAYSVAVFVMMVSFFNNPLSFLWFVYNLFVLYATLRFIRAPSGGKIRGGVAA